MYKPYQDLTSPSHLLSRHMCCASNQCSLLLISQEDIAKSMLAEFNLGCSRQDLDHQYRVYVATFLGFGGNSIRKMYEEFLIANATAFAQTSNSSVVRTGLTPESAIVDPCLNLDMNDSVVVDGVSYHLVGTGNFALCHERLQPYLNQSVPCVKEPCSLNGMYQPEISGSSTEFYGFAEFYYTMEDILHIGGKYDSSSYHEAAEVSIFQSNKSTDFCSTCDGPVLSYDSNHLMNVNVRI